MRVGCGFDAHAFCEGRKLILGGVEIAGARGLAGHSDADVLTHAICDALLGAAAEGDIGEHFPDGDEKYKDASSVLLLAQIAEKLRENGARIINIDATIALQSPKISAHKKAIRESIARALSLPQNRVNIKATTTENLGFIGRKEGAAAFAVALIEENNDD